MPNRSNPNHSSGGIAPFGYRWQDGSLVIDETEAAVRKLIYQLFLKHKRKKTVANILNDLGHRTRNQALFSDTTIDRLLRDSTAKGIRSTESGKVEVEPIIDIDLWERVNNLLTSKKPGKQTVHLFSGIIFCSCGGKMILPSSSAKYVCIICRRKIGTEDLEEIFASKLSDPQLRFDEEADHTFSLADCWNDITNKEKRIIIEHLVIRIEIGADTIQMEFGITPHSFKTASIEQQNEVVNKTPIETISQNFTEPLLSEAEAAKFLGISKMTLLRKRNAEQIRFFRVGFRVLYSKEKHLIPFLNGCERENPA